MPALNMGARLSEPTARRGRSLCVLGFALLFVFGFAAVFLSDPSNRVETQLSQVLARTGFVKAIFLSTAGLFLGCLLVRFGEIALALFFLVGLVKGDPRLA